MWFIKSKSISKLHDLIVKYSEYFILFSVSITHYMALGVCISDVPDYQTILLNYKFHTLLWMSINFILTHLKLFGTANAVFGKYCKSV